MSTEHFLLSAWTWNPVVLAIAAAGLVAYLFAFRAERRIGWLLLALVIFVATLVSPLNALADGYLFSAHMIQHIILLLIVPGLLLLSLPRSLSLAWRPRILAHPLAGWIAGVGAMWFWHWPTLCNAAVTSRSVYALQTTSLVVLGTLFWSQVIAPREEERLSPPGAVLYLFSACVACSALGIILTFSPVTVCSIYTHAGGRPARHVGDDSDRLGIHSGKGSTDWRTPHVGADVFHLSQRDLRANRALVRRSTPPAPGNLTNLMEPNTEQSHEGWERAPGRASAAAKLFSRRTGHGDNVLLLGLHHFVGHSRGGRGPFHRLTRRMDQRNSP